MPVAPDRLFITRVPQSVTKDELAAYFEQFGNLTDVYVPSVPGAQSHKGIAYVSFEHPDSVRLCLAHPNGEHNINGESVIVEECIPKGAGEKGKGKEKGKAMNGSGDPVLDSLGLSPAAVIRLEAAINKRIQEAEDKAYSAGFAAGIKQYEASFASSDRPRPSSKFVGAASTPSLMGSARGGKGVASVAASKPTLPEAASSSERLFITKIPGESTQDEVYAHFSQYGTLTDLFMPSGHFQAGHKGIAFISYVDHNALLQAIQHAPHELRGQQLVVDIAAPRGMEGKGVEKGVVVKQEPGIKPGRMFLTKVDASLTVDDLTEYFQQWGQLEDVFIPSGGKSIAYVSFIDDRCANAAIAEQHHQIRGFTVVAETCIERPGKGKGKDSKGKGKYSPY